MKTIKCPLNGPRGLREFVFGGDIDSEPQADAPVEEWSNHVFMERNPSGVVDEWWFHVPSCYWFVARRDRSTDEILATFTVEEYFGTEASE